jgi:arabinogalactan endo-1,4-beta-galactosidase
MPIFNGCKKSAFKVSLPFSPEDSDVYVEAVPDLSDDFIRGMDASSVLAEEKSGVKFFGFDGKEQDVFKTFAEAGINFIRLRVWNDPYDENGNGYGGGNNDVETAIALGKRATKFGMKVCIDFHYSDFWADPKRQHAPKAWKNFSAEEKSRALYDFTKESLEKIIRAGVDVRMVQIGNEINYGMAGEKSPGIVNALLKSGSRAVRETEKKFRRKIQVVVHYTRITENAKLFALLDRLESDGVDYDTVGLSYYPFWDGTFKNMQNVVSKIKSAYKKNAVIAETSYCYTSEDGDGFGNSFAGKSDLVKGYDATVQGQADMIRDVVAKANEAGASGVFYWEGAWIPVGRADEDNSATWEKFGSGWASSFASEYDPEDAGLFYGGSSWDNQAFFDFSGHPLPSINVWKFLKYGTTFSSAKNFSSAKEDEPDEADFSSMENLVKNFSFENSDRSMWKVSFAGKTDPTDFFEKPEDAHSGDFSFHFFSADSDMEFSVEQEFSDLQKGTYFLTAFSQGGGFDKNASFELYARTTSAEQTDPFKLTTYIDWKNPRIPEIKVDDGNLKIGVRIKCNAKSWGTVDDFALYKIN